MRPRRESLQAQVAKVDAFYNQGVRILMETDEFSRLTCKLSDVGSEAVVTASDTASAKADLIHAVSSVLELGLGECFWAEACGEYRWVFRRENGRVRIAVMWSSGTVTGWNHVFWSECDLNTFSSAFCSVFPTTAP
jgi:hypothetical protein